jgi:hypothetical protein
MHTSLRRKPYIVYTSPVQASGGVVHCYAVCTIQYWAIGETVHHYAVRTIQYLSLGAVMSSQLLPSAPNVCHRHRQFLLFTGRTLPCSLNSYWSHLFPVRAYVVGV